MFTTAGFGLLAATIARYLAQVGLLTILIMALMILLMGTCTPLEAAPAWMPMIMRLSPLGYYVTTSYGISLNGAGVAVLWGSILAMVGLGGVVFGGGVWRFCRRFGWEIRRVPGGVNLPVRHLAARLCAHEWRRKTCSSGLMSASAR
jgi:ABC-2 type transport system permease protein